MNNQQKLLSLARAAAANAYCPYSRFAVGAAIESDDGRFYTGCNVENISYPVGTCAEAGAIAAMIAGGSKKIAAILIYADSQSLISPCGACRQRIAEFGDENTPVYLAGKDGIMSQSTAGELLPAGFKEF
ncbi:MAG: cytidine deaminase [Proteobacteria bacterium]|nr:cytidine deaminase [Pseudomonadota bacterium]